MERENVTISLPAPLIKEAKHLAVDRGISLSKLVGTLLEEQLDSGRRYQEAKERALKLMKRGFPLGLDSQPRPTRDELHER